MPTARTILTDALTFGLNRLSPGEAMDADLSTMGLSALNNCIDEINGGLYTLWREILTAGTVTGSSATFTSVWPTISTGDPILGATYSSGGMDIPMLSLTMQQYHEDIAIKTTGGQPRYYAYDGAETIYFWPSPTGYSITLRTQQMASEFADLDTNYAMPDGWRSGLAALVAEKMAPAVLGATPTDVRSKAVAARARLQGQSLKPSIIGGDPVVGNILTGWR